MALDVKTGAELNWGSGLTEIASAHNWVLYRGKSNYYYAFSFYYPCHGWSTTYNISSGVYGKHIARCSRYLDEDGGQNVWHPDYRERVCGSTYEYYVPYPGEPKIIYVTPWGWLLNKLFPNLHPRKDQ